MNSQVSELLAQAPAGFLPRVYYGLTRGDQKYRFTSGSLIATAPSGDAVGTAYQLLSTNESSNDYIPAVCVKVEDELFDCKIVIPGDYNYTSTSFTLVNMTTGATTSLTYSDTPLTLQNASYLGDYPAVDNKEKQITVLNSLETNSTNVVYASLDYNSDGVYNWVVIGSYLNGKDGTIMYTVNSENIATVLSSYAKIDDLLFLTETFTYLLVYSFNNGDVYKVTSLTPPIMTYQTNLVGPQGQTGATGAPGSDGADGYTPYIQDDYWYINGTSTGVKALGTDGTDGTDGASFAMQSGLYSTPDNWGETGNEDPEGNSLLQLPTLPQTNITGKGYVVYDPLTTPLSPFYDLYFANNGDNSWTIIHPYSGLKGADGADGYTPYIQNGNWYINGTNTGVQATGPQGATGATPTVTGSVTPLAIGDTPTVTTSTSGTTTNYNFGIPAGGVPFLTSAPTADNTSGTKFVFLTTPPATYYYGYIYFIAE